jgi:hypothetical protein
MKITSIYIYIFKEIKIFFNKLIYKNYRECQFLLTNGANPNNLFSEHDGGISAFHIAVGVDNDLEFTRLFLNYNADVYLQ